MGRAGRAGGRAGEGDRVLGWSVHGSTSFFDIGLLTTTFTLHGISLHGSGIIRPPTSPSHPQQLVVVWTARSRVAMGKKDAAKKEAIGKKRAAELPDEAAAPKDPVEKKGEEAERVDWAAGRTEAKLGRKDAEAAVSEGRRVFVANLPVWTSDQQIKDTFGSCGALDHLEWLTHRESGKFRGSGFLTFAQPMGAKAALQLHGTQLDGRTIRVDLAASAAPDATQLECVYVGNLPREFDVPRLRALFDGCGDVVGATIAKKGKGYVRFRTGEAAQLAAQRDGREVDGRSIRVIVSAGFSSARTPEPTPAEAAESSTEPPKKRARGKAGGKA